MFDDYGFVNYMYEESDRDLIAEKIIEHYISTGETNFNIEVPDGINKDDLIEIQKRIQNFFTKNN